MLPNWHDAALFLLAMVLICCLEAPAKSSTQGDFWWHRTLAADGSPQIYELRSEDLNISAKATTLCVRTRAFVPRSGARLLTVKAADGKDLIELGVDDTGKQGLLAFSLKLDVRPEPLVVGVPISMWNPSDDHELLLRYAGYRIDLFVDGVLMDEEWPMGSFDAPGVLTMEVGTEVSEVGVWGRVLSNAEIADRNGGAIEIEKRTDALLGPEVGELQYWRPRGYNTDAGDAMPFFHAGVFHVFFLLDRRHHRSKWGLGAHQWGHISSTDLIHWTRHDPALTITNEWEASVCTGSVFFHNGKFYAFYATRMPDRTEQLGMATSKDGIHFEKTLPTPFSPPKAPYKIGPNRDPFVQREGGLFRMLVTAELAQSPLEHRGGALEQLISHDLQHWFVLSKPFLVPGYTTSQPECSDLFSWRGWNYLLFGQDGLTHYRMRRGSVGLWIKPAIDVLDDSQVHVLKTARFGANRRIGVAFVARSNWGGDLVFRELTQLPDGTLGTKFVPEMVPAQGLPLNWQATGLTEKVQVQNSRVTIHAIEGFGAVAIENVPENVRVTGTLSVTRHADFGVVVRGQGDLSNGAELRFRPALRRAEWRAVSANSLDVDPSSSIEDVEGLDQRVTVDLVVKGDVFDVCINGVRTLIDRRTGISGNRLFLFVQGGELTVTNLVLHRLGEP